MESDKKLELIQKAIRKLMEEEEIKANIEASLSKESLVGVDDNEKSGGQQQLLSKLLSELESLEEEKNVTEESKAEANVEDKLCWAIDESNGVGGREEIMKELKEVKKQNLITHCLLTVMIVLTIAWQLSEVSLILKIKDGLSNPLRSVGGIIGGFFKGRRSVNVVQDVIKQASEMQKQVTEPTYLPGLKIPDLPHLELPGFNTSGDEEEEE
ncbi:UNVERIFIED_CONTAM: hypothetical protein Sradi_6763800 [Sesamum radiatum]|uniref:Uncharacterized protein n=2 Tax=Sesamum TaxID=4181 RepID=A0AAE1WUK6_9LAMI|nr:hypothetical protein Sango_1065900 [Sesamum angolense]